jgi:hypothetical protein
VRFGSIDFSIQFLSNRIFEIFGAQRMKKTFFSIVIVAVLLGVAHVPGLCQAGNPINYDFGLQDDASGWRAITDKPSARVMLFPSGVEIRNVSFKSKHTEFDVVFYSSYSSFGFFSIGMANPANKEMLAKQSDKVRAEVSDLLVASFLPRAGIKVSKGRPTRINRSSGMEYSFELDGLTGLVMVLWHQGVPFVFIHQKEKVTDSRVVEFFLNSNQRVLG